MNGLLQAAQWGEVRHVRQIETPREREMLAGSGRFVIHRLQVRDGADCKVRLGLAVSAAEWRRIRVTRDDGGATFAENSSYSESSGQAGPAAGSSRVALATRAARAAARLSASRAERAAESSFALLSSTRLLSPGTVVAFVPSGAITGVAARARATPVPRRPPEPSSPPPPDPISRPPELNLAAEGHPRQRVRCPAADERDGGKRQKDEDRRHPPRRASGPGHLYKIISIPVLQPLALARKSRYWSDEHSFARPVGCKPRPANLWPHRARAGHRGTLVRGRAGPRHPSSSGRAELSRLRGLFRATPRDFHPRCWSASGTLRSGARAERSRFARGDRIRLYGSWSMPLRRQGVSAWAGEIIVSARVGGTRSASSPTGAGKSLTYQIPARLWAARHSSFLRSSP